LVKLALLIALVAAVPASAQEPPLPEGAIARVGDELVLKSDFDVWHALFFGQVNWLAEDPPDYRRCVTTLRERAARHRRHPTRRSLRQRCKERAQVAHDLAVEITIEQVWVRHEAQRVGIALTLEQIARRAERYKREFSDEDLLLFRRAGVTDAQFSAAVAFSILFQRLLERAQATAPEVTRAQVTRYYAHHRHRYRHLSRERALSRIEGQLEQRRKWRAAERFFTGFFARYTKQTQCAKGYVVEMCANSESDGSDEEFTYEPSRQSSTSISTFPGAGYTGPSGRTAAGTPAGRPARRGSALRR
jgi:hypothetical protein